MYRKDRDDESRRRDWDYCYRRPPTRSELLERLSPLIRQVTRVDEIAARLRAGGATAADLTRLSDILTKEITLDDSQHARKVSLTQPAALQGELYWLSSDLHLEVHQCADQLPCYLLGRCQWHSPADHLLEELYVSSRNDFFPDCFVTMKRRGQSRVALRLSAFRQKTLELLGGSTGAIVPEAECDEVLDTVGKLIFSAAWYEDQRLPFAVADTFALGQFRATLELVAFVLGADLHRVATALATAPTLAVEFFERVYRNEYLDRIVRHLRNRTVPDLNRLEDTGRSVFEQLNSIFGTFLGIKKAIRNFEQAPLYHVVLSFFFSLADVAAPEFWTAECQQAIERVEAESRECAERIVKAFG